MVQTLITLAQIHYELGVIGYDEFCERIRVARWLADEHEDSEGSHDPRIDSKDESPPVEIRDVESEPEAVTVMSRDTDKSSVIDGEDWIKFVCLGVWVFTKADCDSYPSVPHGHYKNQNTNWPKLNPYTGRVFHSKHQEDTSRRLTKKKMKKIWNDEKFKSFCREMIVWYQEQFPHFEFPVRNPLRMPRW